ncbi:MAG: hypothetical protein C0445_06450 [Polaromonas sp.]|nr:hypothetical protein [Polaromonas sp.]
MFQLCRWTLVWFLLTLGVAALSPLAQAKSTVVVCSADGQLKRVSLAEPTTPAAEHHLLDCPLCILADAPPLADRVVLPVWPPGGDLIRPFDITTAVVATATPPPARGPPFFPQSIPKRSLP